MGARFLALRKASKDKDTETKRQQFSNLPGESEGEDGDTKGHVGDVEGQNSRTPL